MAEGCKLHSPAQQRPHSTPGCMPIGWPLGKRLHTCLTLAACHVHCQTADKTRKLAHTGELVENRAAVCRLDEPPAREEGVAWQACCAMQQLMLHARRNTQHVLAAVQPAMMIVHWRC